MNKKFFFAIILFFWLFSQKIAAQTSIVCDSLQINQIEIILKNALVNHYYLLPINEIELTVAKKLLRTKYVGGVVDKEPKECLVVNIKQLDCVTFLENVVVLSILIKNKKNKIDDYYQELTKIRYRNGQMTTYPSRLHYFSEWLIDNENKGILTQITKDIGGIPYEKEISFMTKNRNKYPKLANESFYNEMLEHEKKLNEKKLYYIPKNKIEPIENKLKNGDLIAITTGINNLDIAHVGLVIFIGKRAHLFHASSNESKVVVSKLPLASYLAKNKIHTGIMVARLN